MSRKRLIKILILTILLVGLSIYGKLFNPEIILSMCLAEPERYDGSIITVGTEATVAELLPNGFILQQMGRRIAVYGSVPEIAENEFVNLIAKFHKEGYLELQQIYVAKYRRLKIAASVLPTIVIAILFFRTYRFNVGRFLFYERNRCQI